MTIHKFITNTRRADVSFCDNGRIDLTSRVVRALDIKPGDVIGIMSAAGETYLYVAHRADTLVGRHEGQCHPTRKGVGISAHGHAALPLRFLSNAEVSSALTSHSDKWKLSQDTKP